MNGFIFASNVNDPNYSYLGKSTDASGAFVPGAMIFKEINSISQDICYFDFRVKDADLRRQITDKMRTTKADTDGFDVIAYFGHGIPSGLVSAGFYSEDFAKKQTDHVRLLADAIIATSKQNVSVILYACSAGALPTSFAGALAVALSPINATVYGHEVLGHAFANPRVSVFNGQIGRKILDQYSADTRDSWNKEIFDANTAPRTHTLWARFPMMSDWQIVQELQGGGSNRNGCAFPGY